MKTNQSFSVLFWIYKSKIKNGVAPIYCRISLNGKRAEIATKRSIEESKWNSTAGSVKGNSEEARTINHYLNMLKTDLYSKYNNFLANNQLITVDKLKNAVLGIDNNRKTVLEAFIYHNHKMGERIGIDVVKATHTKFETILSKVKGFIKFKYKVRDMYLEELDFQFLTEFEHYLRVHEKIAHNTTMKYIQNFKKIIRISISNRWLDRNPFIDFTCTFKKVHRAALNQEELEKLESVTFAIERVESIKDIFLFCCYTGLAFIDVHKLTMNEITIGIDGKLWIHTFRKKTDTASYIPLLPVANELVMKYKDASFRKITGKVFDVKSNQKMNAYLKEIADICGIKKNLTMHIARHTFATTVTLSNGVPIETVSFMLGHTRIATTQIYSKVIESKVGDDMQVLQERLENENDAALNEERLIKALILNSGGNIKTLIEKLEKESRNLNTNLDTLNNTKKLLLAK